MAKDIVADLEEIGALVNATDLEQYQVRFEDESVAMDLQDGTRAIFPKPPSGGIVMGLILNIISGYKMTPTSAEETLSYHRFVEAMKFGYGQRMILGDASFDIGIDQLVANLSRIDVAEQFRRLIDDSKTHDVQYYLPGMYQQMKNDHGTSEITAMDSEGNAVAITSTVNTEFGSGVMGRRTGILFNNQMDDFSTPNQTNHYNLPPTEANFIKPGKRPMSSMCPSLFLTPTDDGYKVKLAIGASGGSKIISAVAYSAMRILFFGENPKLAVDALRLHHQLIPDKLNYEEGMPLVILNSLKDKGHRNVTTMGFSTLVQAIEHYQPLNILNTVSDVRKGQVQADGY